MSKRVILGNLGSSLYGLRVSAPGTDAINIDGTAANVDNLLFDSVNPIGHLPLWRYYRRQVSAGTRDGTTLIVTPGTLTVSFGTTLSFAPYAYVYKEVSGGVQSIYGHFSSEDSGYQGARTADDGFKVSTTSSSFSLANYETSSAYFRVFLFLQGV
jgi:hypothetical protein